MLTRLRARHYRSFMVIHAGTFVIFASRGLIMNFSIVGYHHSERRA